MSSCRSPTVACRGRSAPSACSRRSRGPAWCIARSITLCSSPGASSTDSRSRARVAVRARALGNGANPGVFSVVDAGLVKRRPYPNADRVVSVDTKVPGPGKDIFGSAMSCPDIQQLQALTKDFAGVAAYTYARYNYAGRDQARELAATVVSPNLFGVLGVSPAIGRGFTGAELHDQLAVLSYGMWATAFGSDRNIVGRVINLDGQSFTVVGVMPRGFAAPDADTQLWVPLGEALRAHPQVEFNRQLYAFESVARLAAGTTLAQARADVGVVAQRIGAAERAFLIDPLKVEGVRSEERRVGKEGGYRWATDD